MKIAIIGTGKVGGALATQWSKAGHQILLGTRDLDKFKDKHLLENPHTTVYALVESVEKAEVILVAALPPATQSIAEQIKEAAKGKVLIDAMNSVSTKPEGFNSTFEAFRHYLPETEVLKCFNSTGFENMKNPVYDEEAVDMFMAGDSEKGKEIAKQLALDAGFATCWDFGKDDKVRLLEQFALIWINLAIMQGEGRDMAFKVVRR